MLYFRKHPYLIIGGIVLLCIGIYFWRSNSQSKTGQIQYTTKAAEKNTVTASVSASGNIDVDQLATVDPTITGTVGNVSVKVGDSVKKGQLLFTIDNDQLGVNVSRSASLLSQAQAALRSAQTAKDQALEDLNALKKTGGTIGKKDILQQKNDTAKISIASAQLSLQSAQSDYANQLSIAAKRQVTAPISGTVNAVNIKNGDDLSRLSNNSASQAPIIIGDLATMKASVSVNEVDIAHVALGQKAMLKFSALDGLTLTGKVEKMDALGTITQGVVTYDVTIGFDALDSRVHPGMSVSAAIIYDVKPDVVTVPNSAVKSDTSGSYVQVLVNGQPERRSIETGIANSTETEIVSGVSVGDQVVTRTVNPNVTTKTTTQGGGGLRIPGIGGGGR